jgi:hypothetical protein
MTEQNIPDPFAGADPDEDEFETASSDYLALTDLDGRLIVIDVMEIGTKKGEDGPYEYANCNIVVVDGDPIPGYVETIPGVSERMHISATYVLDKIKHKAGTGKPFLARVDVIVNKRKQKVAGVRKHEITDADKALALPAWRAYRAGQFA